MNGSFLANNWFRRIHLFVFLAFLIAWTVALLSPVPQETALTYLKDQDGIFYFGKFLHVAAYAYLTVLGGTLVYLNHRWGWLVLFLVFHGATTEFFQQFVGRTAAVRDVILDSIGIAIGSGIVSQWKRWLTKRKPSVSTPAAGA